MNHAPARARVQRETERAQEWLRESERKRERERGRERKREREIQLTRAKHRHRDCLSCHTYEWVMSHTWISVTHEECAMSHVESNRPEASVTTQTYTYVCRYICIYIRIYMYIYREQQARANRYYLSPLSISVWHTQSHTIYYLHTRKSLIIYSSTNSFIDSSQTVAPTNFNLTHTISRNLLSKYHDYLLTQTLFSPLTNCRP